MNTPNTRLDAQVFQYLPAFTLYEKALVEWLKGASIPREDHTIQPRIEYAGGEKAVRAIRSMYEDREQSNRNNRIVSPLVTIKLVYLEFNVERYHPPESHWGKVMNGASPRTSSAIARVSKGAPYRLSYEVAIYANYEIDMRYMMTEYLNRFAHHGGLAYLRTNQLQSHANIYPMFLRGYNHGANSETGEADREVRSTLLLELEAYLPLPYRYAPIFRKYILTIQMNGSPGELPETEATTTDSQEIDLNAPLP